MDDKELERTERYLRNELSGPELSDFEEKMGADNSFREEVELHKRAIYASRLKGRQQMKERLRQRRPIGRRRRSPRAWVLAAAFLVLAVLAIWWWKRPKPQIQPENAPSSIPNDSVISTITPSVDSNSFPKKQIEETDTSKKGFQNPPIAENKQDTRKLFSDFFQPYKDGQMDPSVRAPGIKLTPFDKFLQSYWEDQHEDVLADFETLSQSSQSNDKVLFMKANSLLATGKADEAEIILGQIIAKGRSSYLEEAKWYLALAYLQNNMPQKAKKLLQAIVLDTNSPRQESAEKLLLQIH